MRQAGIARSTLRPLASLLFAAALGGCGGSDDPPANPANPPAPVPAPPPPAPPPPPPPPPPPAPSPASVTGTVAVGAALPNAEVTVTDTAGAAVCTEPKVVTNGSGTFTCTVAENRNAPFLVVATDPTGGYPPMISLVATTPAAGTTLTANATPLTTAIVAQLAPGADPLQIVADPSLLDLGALEAVTAKVLAQLAPVLAAVGTPADFDPFTTALVGATSGQAGNPADQLIEVLRFSTVNGVVLVGTVDNPDAPVPLASATSANPPALAAPSPGVLSLSESLRLLAGALNRCFALPVSARVLAVDASIPTTAGGPAVTATAPECEGLAHPDYRHFGYSVGQRFHAMLTDETLVGATFAPPEILEYIEDATSADEDRAVLNLRLVDANGFAASMVEVLRKLPGTATAERPTDWWLYGNQQEVDSFLRSFVRRLQQFAPNPGTAPFANAAASRYEAGVEIFVNKDGPGSIGLRAVRVTGPGLPPAGLVLTRLDPAIATDQNWMAIRRKDGLTDPVSATLVAADAANIFRLHRTQGITGTQATTERPNPNAGNTNNTAFMTWAHPLDYGANPGTPTTQYIDFGALRANARYTFEYYYDGETAPRLTYTNKRMIAPVIPATQAHGLQWIDLGAATLAFLDPAGPLAAEQPTLDLAWTPNPFAETVRSAGVYSFGGGINVNQAVVPVVRGATSAQAVAPGPDFRALSADGTSFRSIQLRYRNLDGRFKDAVARYN